MSYDVDPKGMYEEVEVDPRKKNLANASRIYRVRRGVYTSVGWRGAEFTAAIKLGRVLINRQPKR